ncbi:MAG TPA: hypothetical protein VFH22_05275 [Rhodocyclaceae bacterium]|nr:hypothetical protein [Rhodocyclaceae bacterium]
MKYTITGRAAAIHGGVLELTAAQAKPRLHNLKHLGGNRYEVLRTVEFKSGEEIGYSDKLPKSMAMVMEDTAKVAEKASAKAKAAKAESQTKAAPAASADGKSDA